MKKDNERELLFRLMRKLPDGSFEVVGYEEHVKGVDSLIRIAHLSDLEPDAFRVKIMWIGGAPLKHHHPNEYIHHDRKDQYTGIEVDGQKVFERDILRWKDEMLEVVWGSVGWDLTSELFRFPHQNHKDKPSCGEINVRGYLIKSEITGIQDCKINP